jgi:hypothetical protein
MDAALAPHAALFDCTVIDRLRTAYTHRLTRCFAQKEPRTVMAIRARSMSLVFRSLAGVAGTISPAMINSAPAIPPVISQGLFIFRSGVAQCSSDNDDDSEEEIKSLRKHGKASSRSGPLIIWRSRRNARRLMLHLCVVQKPFDKHREESDRRHRQIHDSARNHSCAVFRYGLQSLSDDFLDGDNKTVRSGVALTVRSACGM